MPRVPFARKNGEGGSRYVSYERLVNGYLEVPPAGDAKGQFVVYGMPGLKPWTTAGTGAYRGHVVSNGVLYAVMGGSLVSISAEGSATTLGTIAGSDRVAMDALPNQVIVVAEGTIYVYASGSLTQVSWPGNGTPTAVAVVDNTALFLARNTGEVYFSAVLDATSLNALDFATAEGRPDNALAIVADHGEMVVFGERTTEFWYNSGDVDTPFRRREGLFHERGIGSPLSAATEDNTIFYLADDGSVYRLAGSAPQRVSTHREEALIADQPDRATAFVHTLNGHKFYVLNFNALTLVYDMSQGVWHSRKSYGIARHRVEGFCRCYGRDLAFDSLGNSIFEWDDNTWDENGDPLEFIAVTPPYPPDNTEPFSVANLVLDVESGAGTSTGQGVDPLADMRFSDDGGKTWTHGMTATLGKIGEYDWRARWNRLGRARRGARMYEVRITDPIKRVITGLHINV